MVLSAQNMKMLVTEISIMKTSQHPSIVAYFDSYVVEDKIWVIPLSYFISLPLSSFPLSLPPYCISSFPLSLPLFSFPPLPSPLSYLLYSPLSSLLYSPSPLPLFTLPHSSQLYSLFSPSYFHHRVFTNNETGCDGIDGGWLPN